MVLAKLKPAVSRYWLISLAGLLWSAAGVMLGRLAYLWLTAVPWGRAVFLGISGIFLALIVYRFGFSRIAEKNINRIRQFSEKGCIFAFQAWKSYLIIVIMVALGLFLRHSPIPKQYLAVIYLAVGGALFLSSFHYFVLLWRIGVRGHPWISRSNSKNSG
jgi:uncharacterized membrane protein